MQGNSLSDIMSSTQSSRVCNRNYHLVVSSVIGCTWILSLEFYLYSICLMVTAMWTCIQQREDAIVELFSKNDPSKGVGEITSEKLNIYLVLEKVGSSRVLFGETPASCIYHFRVDE
jgi:hypothetical protein